MDSGKASQRPHVSRSRSRNSSSQRETGQANASQNANSQTEHGGKIVKKHPKNISEKQTTKSGGSGSKPERLPSRPATSSTEFEKARTSKHRSKDARMRSEKSATIQPDSNMSFVSINPSGSNNQNINNPSEVPRYKSSKSMATANEFKRASSKVEANRKLERTPVKPLVNGNTGKTSKKPNAMSEELAPKSQATSTKLKASVENENAENASNETDIAAGKLTAKTRLTSIAIEKSSDNFEDAPEELPKAATDTVKPGENIGKSSLTANTLTPPGSLHEDCSGNTEKQSCDTCVSLLNYVESRQQSLESENSATSKKIMLSNSDPGVSKTRKHASPFCTMDDIANDHNYRLAPLDIYHFPPQKNDNSSSAATGYSEPQFTPSVESVFKTMDDRRFVSGNIQTYDRKPSRNSQELSIDAISGSLSNQFRKQSVKSVYEDALEELETKETLSEKKEDAIDAAFWSAVHEGEKDPEVKPDSTTDSKTKIESNADPVDPSSKTAENKTETDAVQDPVNAPTEGTDLKTNIESDAKQVPADEPSKSVDKVPVNERRPVRRNINKNNNPDEPSWRDMLKCCICSNDDDDYEPAVMAPESDRAVSSGNDQDKNPKIDGALMKTNSNDTVNSDHPAACRCPTCVDKVKVQKIVN